MSCQKPISIFLFTFAVSLLFGGSLFSQDAPPAKNIAKETTQKVAVPQKQNVKPVVFWMNRLSHPKFIERERASSELVKAGFNAIKLLQQQASRKDLESALRAVTVLGEIYHRAATMGDATSFLATEAALMKIAAIPQRTVSQSANTLLTMHSEARKKYAVKAIEKLGGIITWLENENERADFPEANEQQQIAFILLGRKWKGNDDNLQLFSRLPQLETIMISGSGEKPPVSEKGIDILKMTLPKLTIQYRGTACLGVRGSDQILFGAAKPPQGCRIHFVKPGSSADKGGVQVGDIITQFGKKKVADFQMLIEAISDHDPGEKIPAIIQRGGVNKTLSITLQEWKP